MFILFFVVTCYLFSSEGYFFNMQFEHAESSFNHFSYPQGIAVDTSGNIFIADTNNHRILKFNSSGTCLMTIGSYGSGYDQFRDPKGIAVDTSGNIFVADCSNNRVQVFYSSGTWKSTIAGGYFYYPNGVAVDNTGNIYVTDSYYNKIEIFYSSGTWKSSIGSYGTNAGQFSSPYGVAVDNTGNIFVSDSSNNRIQKFNSSGVYQLQFGNFGTGNGQFGTPTGITVDSSGNIFVVDLLNNRVQKFNSSGVYQSQFGNYGTGNGNFYYPMGIAVDINGSIFVADTYNNKIQKFKFGTIYKISGYIRDFNNNAISNISLNLINSSTQTTTSNSLGYYEFTNVQATLDYYIQPQDTSSYEFGGSSIIINSLAVDVSSQNFTADTFSKKISGYIKDINGNPISKIYIKVTTTATISSYYYDYEYTDNNGYYEITSLLKGYDYSLTPIDYSDDYSFIPPTIKITALSVSKKNQNFSTIAPILNVDVSELDFGLVTTKKSLSFKITNTGGGGLSGSIYSDIYWAEIDYSNFQTSSYNPTDTVIVSVDPSNLKRNGKYTGTILVHSTNGGGDISIPVKVQATCVLTRPNPYNPRHGNLEFYGSGVVPNDTEIQIMTINGEHVKTLKENSGQNIVSWDGKNDSGQEISSGIYLYASRSPKEKWLGKFTVVKK
jgi:sugar lactone lactonase YvrE